MRNQIITNFEERMMPLKMRHPDFRPGDSLSIHYKVEETAKSAKGEKKKYRIQHFDGVCIRFKKGGSNSTFTVRRVGANNIGVERVFPLNSPLIEKIVMTSPGTVRRSRLYYLRNLVGKAARIRSRRLPEGTRMSSVPVTEA